MDVKFPLTLLNWDNTLSDQVWWFWEEDHNFITMICDRCGDYYKKIGKDHHVA